MNDVATISTELLHRIRGFCNVFASSCSNCLRRNSDNCSQCVCVRAKEIIRMIDSSPKMKQQRYFIEDRNEELFSTIEMAIKQAGHPLYARQIRLDGVYKQKKFWAIRRMVRSGIIVARPDESGRSMFSINPNRNRKGKE